MQDSTSHCVDCSPAFMVLFPNVQGEHGQDACSDKASGRRLNVNRGVRLFAGLDPAIEGQLACTEADYIRMSCVVIN